MTRSSSNVLRFAVALGLLAAAGVATAQKRKPVVDFTASGKWTVDYAANLCVLGRDMVSADRRLRFSIRPSLNANDAVIAITEKMPQRSRLEGYPFVRFSDGSRATAHGRMIWKDGVGWTIINLYRSELAPLEQPSASVEIWFGDQHYRLTTGDMTKAIEALAACERDLLKIMGMTEAEQDSMASAPVFPAGGILKSSDYPDTLLSRDVEAMMGLLLDIDTAGRVTGCKAMESSGIPAFDKHACDIFKKRAKYGPATDKAGMPMRALMYQRVTWLIEPKMWGTPPPKRR